MANVTRIAAIVALLGLVAAGASYAQGNSGSLGAAWPDSKSEVAAAPGWHVYRWVKDGITYIQVNDLAGHPRFAVATANGQVLKLPIGSDRVDVIEQGTTDGRQQAMAQASNKQQIVAAPAAAAPAAVYQDNTVQITRAATLSGQPTWKVYAADCTLQNCSGQIVNPQ